MGQILLFTHLSGAIYLGILIVASLVVLLKKKARFYKSLAMHVAVGTGIQLISGSFLALQNASQVSLLSFCSKIGIYLFTILVIEALLFMRMRSADQKIFPVRLVVTSIVSGIVFVSVAIFHL